jgi:hypothetical protein
MALAVRVLLSVELAGEMTMLDMGLDVALMVVLSVLA